jgi:hypothetical protein
LTYEDEDEAFDDVMPLAVNVNVMAEFFCKADTDSKVPLTGLLCVSVPDPVTALPELVPLIVKGSDLTSLNVFT